MYVELGSFHHTSCWDLWRNFGKVPRWDLWKDFREVPDRMLLDEGGSSRRARPYAARDPHLRGAGEQAGTIHTSKVKIVQNILI